MTNRLIRGGRGRRTARATVVLAACLSAAAGACRGRETAAPPAATPSMTITPARAPLGSPIEITYKFVVAPDAHFDEDCMVMAHVLDTDEELMWTDDHKPPIPTTQWKGGQTIEYRRTVFVPIYPYIGDATVQIGLYSTKSQKRWPLSGDDAGHRAYRVAHLQLLPQTENVFVTFKEGWNPTEVAAGNTQVEWQWTKKRATLSFKNPKKDSLFYLDLDNPGGIFEEPQQVDVSLGDEGLARFTLTPKQEVMKKIPITAAQFGSAEPAEITLSVDKTFVPSLIRGSNSKDPRELGVRVFHAFIEPQG